MGLIPSIHFSSPDFREHVDALRARIHGGQLVSAQGARSAKSSEGSPAPEHATIQDIVTDILGRVREEGDAALIDLAHQLDGAELRRGTLRVGPSELEAAHAQVDAELLALMRRAASNIRAYQEHIRHRDSPPLVRDGRRLGVRYRPVDRAGVYVPGGRALYPSSVLMTVVPAQVAGVSEIALCSPPTGGDIHPLVLAIAHELGVREVYRIGGAVAIGAMAFGTETVPAVQKIAGPGNAFVAEAKRQVSGPVGIDMMAGPSEVIIIADARASARYVAADLLAQAEHDPGSAILITPSEALADSVREELASQIARLERADAIRPSLEHNSALVVVEHLDAACALTNEFAPEHLQIMTSDNARCAAEVRHAGAIFLGELASVPFGDYIAGPSHTLPTGGTARFASAMSCNDFLKASSTIEYEAEGIAQDAGDVAKFATHEGLTAHASSAAIRR